MARPLPQRHPKTFAMSALVGQNEFALAVDPCLFRSPNVVTLTSFYGNSLTVKGCLIEVVSSVSSQCPVNFRKIALVF